MALNVGVSGLGWIYNVDSVGVSFLVALFLFVSFIGFILFIRWFFESVLLF